MPSTSQHDLCSPSSGQAHSSQEKAVWTAKPSRRLRSKSWIFRARSFYDICHVTYRYITLPQPPPRHRPRLSTADHQPARSAKESCKLSAIMCHKPWCDAWHMELADCMTSSAPGNFSTLIRLKPGTKPIPPNHVLCLSARARFRCPCG